VLILWPVKTQGRRADNTAVAAPTFVVRADATFALNKTGVNGVSW
jgi:hypothetical protein